MSIYKPTWLYVKQHRVTGLKYFGKTTKDPFNYNGSGLRWLRHLRAHGSNVDTIFTQLFENKEDLVDFATLFSEFYDIVNSDDWANLCPETGLDGGYRENNHFKILNSLPKSQSQKDKTRKSMLGKKNKSVPVIIDNVTYTSMVSAANALGVTEQKIYKWVKSGKAIRLK